MNTPYRTKKGILIGSNYSKKINYHNEDQDWIQRIALGEKNSYTIDTVVTWTMWALVVYAIAGLLSACGSNNLPPEYSYVSAPVVPIVLESKAEQLSRQQVINGINDCETNSMRAVVVTSKRIVGGFTSDIPIDVQCYPRRSIY
jgi:hypothetical protein